MRNSPFLPENFESATVPEMPDCATLVTPGGTGWTTVNNPGSGFENNSLHYVGGASAADAWFFTKGVHMEANVYYKISYKYGNNSSETTESLVVTRGQTPTVADAEVFATHDAITGGVPTNQAIELYMNATEGIYYFGFHATSAANQGNLYVDDIIIEPVVCSTPVDIQVTDIGQNGATVSWSAPTGSNISVFSVYQYAVVETNTPPADGTYNGPTSVEVAGLDPATTYYVFTRSLCGPVWSEWTEGIPFTTLPCDAVALPYYLDFESAEVPNMAECTMAIAGETGGSWATVSNPGSGFETNALHYEGNDEAADAWFFTRGVELAAGAHYKLTYTYGNDSAETIEGLQVIVASGPDPATAVFTVNELNEITGGEQTTYTSGILGVPADGVYYIGFKATSEAGQGSLYIDNIEVEDWDCGLPQEISVSDITTNSATITWETPEENTSFGYLVAHTTENVAPESGAYVTTLTTDLSDLEPGTTYYVFVKSQCGPLTGEWADAVSFTTLCEAADVPYTLDFESATVPGVPACTIAAEAVSGNNWVTVNNPGNGFTDNALHYAANDEAANAWFYTRGINLTAGTYYKVSYTYGNDSDATTEKLKVTLNSNPDSGSVLSDFANHEAVTGGEPAINTVDYFNVPESGVYYFGFNAYSDAELGSLYVDNFAIEEMDCGVPSDVVADNITDNSADITWEAPSTGNALPSVYQYAFGTTDTPPAEGTFDEDMSVTLDELEPETTYYVFTRTQCGPLWSDWTVTSFTTEATAGIDNPAFSGFSLYPNPVKDIVTLTNTANIDSVEVYNITGQLVYKQTINSNEAIIILQTLSAGAYLLNVSAGGETNRVKIIKE